MSGSFPSAGAWSHPLDSIAKALRALGVGKDLSPTKDLHAPAWLVRLGHSLQAVRKVEDVEDELHPAIRWNEGARRLQPLPAPLGTPPALVGVDQRRENINETRLHRSFDARPQQAITSLPVSSRE